MWLGWGLMDFGMGPTMNWSVFVNVGDRQRLILCLIFVLVTVNLLIPRRSLMTFPAQNIVFEVLPIYPSM